MSYLSSQRIRDIALELFTKKGYEGASLADIAELVGIKKSSIYNHYKSKDDLFLTICETSSQADIASIKSFFEKNQHKELFTLLGDFLELRTGTVYQSLPSVFLFRFIAFPPFHLQEQITALKIHHFTLSGEIITKSIAAHSAFQGINPEAVQQFSQFYVTILNGNAAEKFIGRGINAPLAISMLRQNFAALEKIKIT